MSNAPGLGDWFYLAVVKTNGSTITLSVTNNNAGETIDGFCQLLMNAVNGSPGLQNSDGITAADLYPGDRSAQFFLYARASGWASAQIQITGSASTNLVVSPVGAKTLEDNLADLRPRNHLYVGSGLGALPISLTLETSRMADGFHQLALVAYEGTSVRTQMRISRKIIVQNTRLSATLDPQISGTNATLDTALSVAVIANTILISTIELFSTGGSIGLATNQQSAIFSVPLDILGLGLHPFYAVVMDDLGNRFRTATSWIRIIPSFQVTIAAAPLELAWSAVPGLSYDDQVSTNLSGPFQHAATVTASTTLVQWPLPVTGASQNFYRVRLSP